MLNISSQKLIAGDLWTWDEEISGYSSDDYDLSILLKLSNGTLVTLDSSDNTTGSFTVRAVASETADLTNGNYTYYARLTSKTDAEDVTTYETGLIHIYPNIATTAVDIRSNWAKIYDNLLSAYNDMVEAGHIHTTVSINGRATTVDRAQLLIEIRNAATAAGIDASGIVGEKPPRQILTRL